MIENINKTDDSSVKTIVKNIVIHNKYDNIEESFIQIEIFYGGAKHENIKV